MAKYLLSAPQSHNVVVIARSAQPLQKLKEQYGKQVEVLNGDLSDFSLAQTAVALAIRSFGRLDGMILNHGLLGQVNKVSEAEPEQWRQGFDINFFSLVAFVGHIVIHLFLPSMQQESTTNTTYKVKAALSALRASKGKVIFTSSGAAVKGYPGWALYGATKAAMNHFALSLGAEEPNVTSISIRPGMVDTDMQRELREDHVTNLDSEIHSHFTGVYLDGQLLRPEQPGHVMARLVLNAPNDLSGRFLSYVVALDCSSLNYADII